MNRLLPVILLFFFFVQIVNAQQITNSRFEQVGRNVEIYYTLDKQADITICISTDGGLTYSEPLKALAGDVGKNVEPGQKKAIWSPLEECDGIVSDNVVFKIIPGGKEMLSFSIKGVDFNMILVEGGTFDMGCTSEQGGRCNDEELPVHSVTLDSYYIGQTEVTQKLWKAVMGSNPSSNKSDENLPVEMVSWNDCQAFVRELNRITKRNFSLPTEAQWEYAARGGNKSRNYKYAGSNNLLQVAYYFDNASSTMPVASRQPNELGLYDMAGNVWEWCYDFFDVYSSTSQTNPQGPATGGFHIIRGGCWHNYAAGCRVSYRSMRPRNYSSYNGFRLALIP